MEMKKKNAATKPIKTVADSGVGRGSVVEQGACLSLPRAFSIIYMLPWNCATVDYSNNKAKLMIVLLHSSSSSFI